MTFLISRIINKFLEDKEQIFKNAQEIMNDFRKKIKENIGDSEVDTLTKETEQKIAVVSEEFNKLFESTAILMENEMQLHESITVSLVFYVRKLMFEKKQFLNLGRLMFKF